MSHDPGYMQRIEIPHVNINMDEWRKKLQETAEKSISWQIAKHFQHPFYTHAGSQDKGGVGYEMLKESIEAETASEDFERKISAELRTLYDQALKKQRQ